MEVEEPLCLEYATAESVPLHLRQILSQLKGKISDAELLMTLIYVVALESGFVEDQTYAEHGHLLKPVPAVGCFHIYNVRLLSQLPLHFSREFEDSAFRMLLHTMQDEKSATEASELFILKSRLMAVVLGDLLMVTLSPVPPSKERGYSVCLSIGRFVLNMKLATIYERFRQLDELSLQLRQQLFQPMRAQQLLAINLHLHPSLMGLPTEVYSQIFQHLSKNQLNIVANVNWQLCDHIKQFKEHCEHES
ncbi:protein nutcracker [Drosophila grimshawi]|uniref:protein nutcracker n=1 Tax=Drosophila grimshawi TaxID=7222 RepID=UPI001C9356C4|nr:protein nutcracker [Drosophila grimshawi]